ncbi:MAG: tRNA pseudouridine(54/55) synthase Pus10 [Candidatus Bathyarchaeota archaeon]|nr:tRNA pseudouridine(54/55) synthase Pus10 [Candidatus Bathyarchaeota archaeon]
MDVLEKAYELLSKYPLCDHCLGRQFAQLGYCMENNLRGAALKVSLVMAANDLATQQASEEGIERLRVLASNGFCDAAKKTLEHLKKSVPTEAADAKCHLCDGKFAQVETLTQKALDALKEYEFKTFLVGIELPIAVEEREDEFKGTQNISYGESIRHEFGRVFGKALAKATGKEAEYLTPEVVPVIDPFQEKVKVQINPLFVGGRYRKLVRTIPQSEWFCSSCHGRGCEKCGGTGKLYPESVEAFTSKPLLEATGGEESFFHASGREDIDARMLGSGRPYIVEVSKPKKRAVDLKVIEQAINAGGLGKVEVSELHFATKDDVRHLKKGEGAQKEYRLLAEFEHDLTDEGLRMIEEKLTGALIKQQTPLRVVHRRADIVRERYIYKLEVKKVTLKRALLLIRCQGGLYVKELVSGDEGRTVPNVSALLDNPAKTLKLDVLNVIME